ncbi:MAG: hypothetical protein LBN95_03300 [Prevotellaceae bacterium]|nr:hypothetical protein [Prevotellaceae bacterium]
MRKYFVLIFLTILSFSNSTLKASNNQYDPFEWYTFQNTEIPLPSQANPFQQNTTLFSENAQLRGIDDEDDFETGAGEDNDCTYVDGCTLEDGKSVLILMILAYTLIFIRKKSHTF